MGKNYLENNISPFHLFICGIILIPAFLIQQNIWIRLAQTLLFMILCFLTSGNIKILPTIIISISIIIANLIIPSGRIFFYIGPLPITAGAFEIGIIKATTLIGLIHISRFSVKQNLNFPGHFGKLIGKVFYYFEKITELKITFFKTGFIKNIDSLLLNLQNTNYENITIKKKSTTFTGFLIISLLIQVNWSLVFINHFYISPFNS